MMLVFGIGIHLGLLSLSKCVGLPVILCLLGVWSLDCCVLLSEEIIVLDYVNSDSFSRYI